MSGGHFDYMQYTIEDIAHDIEVMAQAEDDDEVRQLMTIAAVKINEAAKILGIIDWFVCGDYDKEDLKKYLRRYLNGHCCRCKGAEGTETND